MSSVPFRALLIVFIAAVLGGSGAFGDVRETQAQPVPSQWSTLDQLQKSTGRSLYSGPDGPVEVTWTMETEEPISSPPTVGEDGTLYVGGGPLYAFGPEGEKRWRFEAKREITRTPAVAPDGTIHAVSNDSASGTGRLYAIEPGGAEKWLYETEVQLRSDPIVGPDGTVYVSSGRRPPSADEDVDSTRQVLFGVGPEGKERWRRAFDEAGEISSPTVGPAGTVYVATSTDLSDAPNRSDGQSTVHALDSNGKKHWSTTTDGLMRGKPVIRDEGMVYVGSRTGSVGVLHTIGPTGAVRWRSKLHPSSVPVAVGRTGIVYILGGTHLRAMEADGVEVWQSNIRGFPTLPVIGSQGMVYFSYRPTPMPTAQVSGLGAIGVKGTTKWHADWEATLEFTAPMLGPGERMYVGATTPEGGVLYALDDIETPRITVSRGQLHLGLFGAPSEAHNRTMSLTIKNEGVGTLEGTVEGLDAASPFSVVEGAGTFQFSPPDRSEVSSGPVREITVAYAPETPGIHEDELTIRHNGQKASPIRVSIKGGVVPGSPLAEAPWPLSGVDRQNTSRSPHEGPDAPVEKKWQFTGDGQIEAAPAVGSDGTLYVGTNSGMLYAVSPDGNEQWRFEADTSITSTPAIGSDGTVYVSTEKGTLYALGTDGTERWRFSPNGLGHASAPALARDGTLYVRYSGGLLALGSGQREKWRFDLRDPGDRPAIGADGTLYVGEETQGNSDLYAVGPEGNERWRSRSDGETHSSPVVGPDGTMYVSLAECRGEDYVAQSCRGAIEAHVSGPRGGWSYGTDAPLFASPALGADGTLYVGSEDGVLYAIGPEGKERWQVDVEGGIKTSPVIGIDEGLFRTNETIYLGTDAGVLHAIEDDGDEKWTFIMESAARTSPVIGAQGRLYIGAGHSLIAIGPQ